MGVYEFVEINENIVGISDLVFHFSYLSIFFCKFSYTAWRITHVFFMNLFVLLFSLDRVC